MEIAKIAKHNWGDVEANRIPEVPYMRFDEPFTDNIAKFARAMSVTMSYPTSNSFAITCMPAAPLRGDLKEGTPLFTFPFSAMHGEDKIELGDLASRYRDPMLGMLGRMNVFSADDISQFGVNTVLRASFVGVLGDGKKPYNRVTKDKHHVVVRGEFQSMLPYSVYHYENLELVHTPNRKITPTQTAYVGFIEGSKPLYIVCSTRIPLIPITQTTIVTMNEINVVLFYMGTVSGTTGVGTSGVGITISR